MNKVVSSLREAVADIPDGASIMVSGFASTGAPLNLLDALVEKGIKNLTIIGIGPMQMLPLVEGRQVKKVIVTYAVFQSPSRVSAFEKQYLAGEIDMELVPLGTFVERIRAGGAGIGAFYCPVGIGTAVEERKEKRLLNGKEYLLETALTADFSLIKGYKADRFGNITCRMSARNINPVMAMAGRVTIAEVEEIVEAGKLDPETMAIPAIFVDRVVRAEKRVAWWPGTEPKKRRS
jgi:3-oxoacid CoA-transferase subunit A